MLKSYVFWLWFNWIMGFWANEGSNLKLYILANMLLCLLFGMIDNRLKRKKKEIIENGESRTDNTE